jgi:prepilin-type N-terminal cleavage/methylation domain-containing protein
MNARIKSARGFTLIELLVVVTIIGLLAAILVPSILGAMEGAKKARAMSQIKDLDGAVKRYFAEYGKMPVPPGQNGGPDRMVTGVDQARVIEILINTSSLNNVNPRQIVFLDLDPVSFGVKTLDEMAAALAGGTPYRDPWGNDYGILMDLNFDDRLTSLGGFGDIRAKVGVFSGGQHGNVGDPPYKTW